MPRALIAGLFLVLLAGCTAAPVKQATGTGPFLIFFQEWSAALDDPAKATLANVAERAKAAPNFGVMVTGFADPTGSVEANIDVSRLRARLVSDTLIGLGVSPARIQRRSMGEVGFTGTALESRRVEITLVAP